MVQGMRQSSLFSPSTAPVVTVTLETMHREARSTPARKAASDSDTERVTSVSWAFLNTPALRAFSRALFTASRRLTSFAQRSRAAASRAKAALSPGMSLNRTLSAFTPWACFMACQISSDVRARMGAMSRVMPSRMWYRAVWAERRSASAPQ